MELETKPRIEVDVANLDVVEAALRNSLSRLSRDIKSVLAAQRFEFPADYRINNLEEVTNSLDLIVQTLKSGQREYPTEIKINNLSDIQQYFETLAQSLKGSLSITLPEPKVTVHPPQITVQPTPVTIPEIDLSPIIKAIDRNLNKIRTNDKGRPLAVRLSDGQEFIEKMNAVMERQEIAFAGFNENMRLRDAQGNPINPATREDIQSLVLAINNLTGASSILAITSFTNDKNAVEIGSSVTSTVLTWTLNRAVNTQSLNNSIGSITASLRTYTHTSAYSTDRTYTLTVDDGTTTIAASTTVAFQHKRYWGVSSNTSLNDAQIIALSKELSSTRVKSITGLTPSAQYLYFCYPASQGLATFSVNGFVVTDFVLSVQNHVNASGNTTSYNIYRSANPLTGTYNMAIS